MTTTAAVTPGRTLGVKRVTYVWAIVNLVAQIVIVFTGGLVRLTGSGLGCSDWPFCEPGQFAPKWHEAASYYPFVEFGNRTLSGVLAAIALVVFVLALRERGRVRSFKVLAAMPLAGVAVQAVVGGIAVLTELDPNWVGFHLLISVAIVWLSAWLVARCREADTPATPAVVPALRTLGWVMAGVFAVIVVLGVITTGSGPHSGDTARGYRYSLDPALMARVHAGAVWLFVILLIGFLVALHRTAAPAPARRAGWWLLAATGCQAVIGVVQYAAGLPIGIVSLHMLGIALTTTALTFALLSLRQRPRPAPAAKDAVAQTA